MGGFLRVQQFSFQGNSSVSLSVTSTSSNVQLPLTGVGINDLEITNSGTSTAWVAFGDTNAITAVIPTTAANGYIILAGQTKVINVSTLNNTNGIFMAGISAAATTTTLYVTLGQGA